MYKSLKKILSIALSALMVSSAVALLPSVGAATDDKVRVIVKNDTYSAENGAPWDGELVDEWVDIDETSTAVSALLEVLDNHGYTQSGAEYGYITALNGISSGDNGSESGWSITLNDWFTSESITAYTVENGKLESGDEISVMYSSNGYGADLGSHWDNTDTSLASVEITGATLNGDFSPSITEYTLYIDSSSADVNVIPTANNKNYLTKKYKNTYSPSDSSADYKRSESINVTDGDKIIIGVGDESWPTMNSTAESTVYTFNVVSQNMGQTSLQTIKDKVESTAAYLLSLDAPTVSSTGGEWMVIGLARADMLSNEFYEKYYENVLSSVTENASAKLSSSKSTENSRVVLALTSMGKDVTDVASYNLLEPLADLDYVEKQGLNGPVWALIALDSGDYEIPETDAENVVTRQALIEYILSKQLDSGGWTFYGSTADPDMTGMAIQALAPYYSDNENVKTAVDNALTVISEMQSDDGSLTSWGTANSESCAQMIVALTSLGINPQTDSRFIKNGCTLIDAMMNFSVDNGFAHSDDTYNQMATEQSFYALVSYLRLTNDDTSLYDMTDKLAENYAAGDVNLDGYVNIIDVTLIKKYITGLSPLSKVQYHIADYDKNSVVSVIDSTRLHMSIVGL